jgi:hypothetical protein
MVIFAIGWVGKKGRFLGDWAGHWSKNRVIGGFLGA